MMAIGQHLINCESAIGQHLNTNPECAKTYTDDNFRIIGQARSSFHYVKIMLPLFRAVVKKQILLCIFITSKLYALYNRSQNNVTIAPLDLHQKDEKQTSLSSSTLFPENNQLNKFIKSAQI